MAAARADEAAILADIQAFFETGNDTRRQELARRIETDPGYARARVSGWLHRADLFEHLDPGRRQIRVPIEHDKAARRKTL